MEPEPGAEGRSAHNHRSRLYNTSGVILRRRDIGESDRIIVVYTEEHGKRSFSARGSRKPTSKIAGQIEPFSLVDLHVARTRSVDIISQVVARNLFANIRTSEQLIAVAGIIAELVDSMTPEDQPNRSVSDLLVASLTLLDAGHDPVLILVACQLGLLRHLGYRPSLATCSVCGEDLLPIDQGFSLESGVVCPNCRRNAASVMQISAGALKLLRATDRGELTSLLRLKIDPRIVDEADHLLAAYIRNIVGRPSRAREVVRELRLQ